MAINVNGVECWQTMLNFPHTIFRIPKDNNAFS